MQQQTAVLQYARVVLNSSTRGALVTQRVNGLL